jgi:hypothetical protein
MDNELLAQALVAGYLAGHALPEKNDMQQIAENLTEFFKLTKAELDKSNANAHGSPIGFGSRSVDAKTSIEDRD